MWERESVEKKRILAVELLAFSGILFSLFGAQFEAMTLGIVILIYIRFHLRYLDKVGEGLTITKERSAERLHIGENSEWFLTFQNGKYPMKNAKLQLLLTDHIEPSEGDWSVNGSLVEWETDISLEKYENVTVTIPFRSIRRGKAKVVSVRLKIPHLFGYGETVLRYNSHLSHSKLIYPEIEKVSFQSLSPVFKSGEDLSSHSLFEDLTMPAGTREYRPGDTIQRLNWNAYAKTGELQTNVYERVTEEKMMILLNVSHGHAKNIEFEKLIRQAAFLVTEAHRNNRSIGLAVNVRTKGSPHFYFLPPEKGTSHSRKLLEMLSVLSIGDVTLPSHLVINQLNLMQLQANDVIHIGQMDQTSAGRLSKMSGRVWIITESGGTAVKWNDLQKNIQ
ncbi:DUF58 domain-containing protein [Jeotgalibacillus sp. R-1-5s-1]|uniref:DUF58 domain-containing protein n=1 Tax=Jeotgalibacillus sp. R-1-5s-1 TaxID=2555897 RepID=UPI00106BD9BE|nr:DUF58 domain-containing protein [Jeotgalibacillus sp. R-1-5s-1]TFE03676.1 DUF58 domain-containing protein [Jeotgalibacillus sp. R-1-5s-1]